MDTPSQESTGAINASEAGSLIANLLSPEPVKDESAEASVTADDKAPPAGDEPAGDPPNPPADEGADPPEPVKVTIRVDGKTVELTQEQIADAYKNGMRQEDYTRKTMEAADKRKAAEADIAKARQEREQYAQGLQQASALLQASLQEQSQIDWQKLLDTDPVEYLKQQHLAQDRQAKLQRIAHEQQQLHAKSQAEQADQMKAYMSAQRDELLAKLPDWKDESKAKTEQAALKEYLKSQGFDDESIAGISDHRAVLMSRKAMLYDQMMTKAQAAAKKVANLPQKVERPGNGETNHSLDKRGEQYKKLSKSGNPRDAAGLIANFL